MASKPSDSANNIYVKLQKLANENTAKTFKFNKEESKISRDWQKMMSDTSHQREVKDLQKAGLNPVLSSNSGAQAYSTQSASGVADSAVNAIGNVASSNVSAKATRYAADRSYQASLRMAAAQQYAAQMNYAAQKYHSDAAERASKYRADMDYKIAIERPQNNPWGIADKFLSNAGVYGSVRNNTKSTIVGISNKLAGNPTAFFENKGKINKENFVLSKQGMIQANRGLQKLDINNTNYNQRAFIKAFVFDDNASQRYLANLVAEGNRRKSQTAVRWHNRYGSGVW